MKFTQEDVQFMEALNSKDLPEESRIYLTVKHGYIRNMDRDKMQRLEQIYHRAISDKFHLCYHCNNDVMQMVRELYQELEKEQKKAPVKEVEPEPEVEPTPEPKPIKVSRKSKGE